MTPSGVDSRAGGPHPIPRHMKADLLEVGETMDKDALDAAFRENAVARASLQGACDVAKVAVDAARSMLIAALLKKEEPNWSDLEVAVVDAVESLNVEWRISADH